MRVLLVNDLPPGPGAGAEVYLQRLATGLIEAGDEVGLFAGEVAHHGLRRVLDGWDPWARQALVRRAAAFRPDVVHHHNVLRELSVAVLGVPAGTPSVLTVHDHRLLGGRDSASGRHRLDQRIVVPFARAVARRRVELAIGVSQVLARGLRAAGFRRVAHVPVPVLPPAAPPRRVQDCFDVAYVGRLSQDKGLRVLVAAFAGIAGRYPDSRLLVAGDGPLREWLATRATARVVPLGRLDALGVSRLLAAVRAVAVPSLPALRPEGSSLSAVEAAMHGRAVVTSNDPALLELGLGVAVPAGSVPALAGALDQLLGDAALAARLGAHGAELARSRHDVGSVVAKMRTLYAGV